MKRRILSYLKNPWTVALILAAVFLGCEGDYRRPSRFRSLDDLNRPDCRVGVWEGRDSDRVARSAFPNARIVPFELPEDAFVALLAGKLEAFVSDEHILNVGRRAYPLRLKTLDFALEREPAFVAVRAKDPALLAQVNDFIGKYRRDGTSEAMWFRWCAGAAYVPEPKIAEAPAGAPELRIGTSGLIEPSTFIDGDGRLTGYDIEFARRLAKHLGRRPRFVLRPDGDFDGELLAGKIDLIVDNVDDRVPRKGIAFSVGYLDADMKVLVAEDDPALADRAVAKMLGATRFGMTDALIGDPRVRLFLNGLLVTVSLVLLSAFFGFLVARPLRGRVAKAVGWIRWVPPPVLVLLSHEALLGFAWPHLTAVVALALHFAARLADEPETKLETKLVGLLQWTCAVGMIDVFDLTMAADLVCGRSWQAVFPLLGVALAYAGLSVLLVQWARRK